MFDAATSCWESSQVKTCRHNCSYLIGGSVLNKRTDLQIAFMLCLSAVEVPLATQSICDDSVSLIDWISDTCPQGCTDLQSPVKCLDHR